MKQYLNIAGGLFFVLCVVFIPFVYQSLQLQVTGFIFGVPVEFLGSLFFKNPVTLNDFSSDTRSLLLLLLLLAIIAGVSAIFIKKKQAEIIWACKTIALYFLAYVLLKYGFDKVFCRQFYQPAPNILFTPFGNLDKDILYWSTMGTSPAYSIITGSFEVLAALLLLLRRTRALGLLLALTALVQIIIVNFSFDISVKVFSLLLTVMGLYLLAPQLKSLYNFLVLQKMALLPQPFQVNVPKHIKMGLRFFIVGLMLIETLTSQLYMRDPGQLTGAYKVESYIANGSVLDSCQMPVKRIFIHPKQYLILQSPDDKMTDFHFTRDFKKQWLTLTGYDGIEHKIHYERLGDTLRFNFLNGTIIKTTPLPWQNMPALQNRFHFMVDEIKE